MPKHFSRGTHEPTIKRGPHVIGRMHFVQGDTGEYDARRRWVVCGFSSPAAAQQLASDLTDLVNRTVRDSTMMSREEATRLTTRLVESGLDPHASVDGGITYTVEMGDWGG